MDCAMFKEDYSILSFKADAENYEAMLKLTKKYDVFGW
jgi:hypothetical protein